MKVIVETERTINITFTEQELRILGAIVGRISDVVGNTSDAARLVTLLHQTTVSYGGYYWNCREASLFEGVLRARITEEDNE